MEILSPPRVRSSRPAADYTGFFQALKQAFDLHTKSTQVPDDWKPLLAEDYPKERTGAGFDHAFDVILFHVVEAAPAATSNDGSRRPQAPVLRETRKHPGKAGYHQLTFGWKEEALVQFTLCAKSNAQANRMVPWFQRFLMAYIYGYQFFASRGVEKFYFLRRLEDTTTQKYGQELYVRSLQYHVRLNFLDECEVKDLESVHITVRPESLSADSPVSELDIRR